MSQLSLAKAWPSQLRVAARGRADDCADYQPPAFHVGSDGQHVTTFTLHSKAGDDWSSPNAQLSLTGGDGAHRLEACLLEMLAAVRAGRVVR